MILNGKQTQNCSQFQKRSMTIEERRKQTIFFISVLLLLSPAGAQSGPNGNSSDPYKYPKFSPSMAIIIAILVAALFFMGFFSVYIRHCSDMAPGASGRQLGGLAASVRRRGRGLDTAVIEAFPTLMYSEVKGLKIGKGALECAVCLNEFEDDETLRLIPKCDHVFHPECIDAWLNSHVTCPVCRANLVPQPGETPQLPDLHSESAQPAGTQNNDDVSVRVVEEDQEVTIPPQVMDRNRSFDQTRQWKSRSMRAMLFGKFPRSHSTGHSVVQPGENTERFTLRLPVDVRKRVMKRALDRTTSCVVVLPSEGGSRRGYQAGVGEGSSRGGRSYRRVDRVVKSDRWIFSVTPPFFSRTSSLKSPKVTGVDGEGSTRSTTPRGSKTAVKMPSFKCLEPKGDETGLVSADSARCPV